MSVTLFVAIGAAAAVALYLSGRQLRRFGAWSTRREGPRERTGVFVMLFALAGAALGGAAHQPVIAVKACHAGGEPVIPCLMRLTP